MANANLCLLLSLLLVVGCGAQLEYERFENDTSADIMYAFSAELSSIVDVASGSNLIFDHVITNVGEMYFPNSGQFGCPDSGLYVLIWSIMKGQHEEGIGMRCATTLQQSGTQSKYGPETSYFSYTYSGVTQMMMVVQCIIQPLTAITVKVAPWSETVPTARFFNQYTSFSGFKLQSSIAFSAELSEDQYLFPGSRIRFDRVLSNFGGYFNDVHSYFMCPDDGVYVFSISTQTKDYETPWSATSIMIEKEFIVSGPVTYMASPLYDSGSSSSMLVFQCRSNEAIYVESTQAHDFKYNSFGEQLTSFSGFRLANVNDPDVAAFTAVMTVNRTLDANDTVIFDEIITNVGNAFNPGQSFFTCPDDDYYLFTWSAVAETGDTRVITDLYMEFTFVKALYLTKTLHGNSTSGTCTVSVIKQCVPGSRVQIRARSDHSRMLLGGYTSFSGFKIPGEWV